MGLYYKKMLIVFNNFYLNSLLFFRVILDGFKIFELSEIYIDIVWKLRFYVGKKELIIY